MTDEARLSDPDPAWRLEAACLADPELFIGNRRPSASALARARAICRTCSVLAHCNAYAHRTEPTWGIWAGIARHDNRVRFNHSLTTRTAGDLA